MLNVLRRSSGRAKLVRTLHAALVAQARQPVFFREYGVPDTIDGRFDMVAFHAWLVFERLQAVGQREVAQDLSTALFVAFDEALRDLGAGDMGMGPRMKKLGNAINGRLLAYEAATGDAALAEAIQRNIYRGAEGNERAAASLARYARAAQAALAQCDLSDGHLAFPPIPSPGEAA
ncbi:MAG: ubiquinol-cytochrome C chaperone [Proteobacteria bacterium]|nr:ubiquinol-cytochrome C chaperone [Pseudomonadota bacterium]